MSEITLSIPELRRAGVHGLERWVKVVARGLRAEYGEDNADPRNHIIGAWGECVVARYFGCYWPTDNGPDGGAADVGCYHVRTGRRESDRLILHDTDADDAIFVLVVVVDIPRFRIVGWCYGVEGKNPDHWQSPVTGRPAYFMPRDALRSVDELREVD